MIGDEGLQTSITRNFKRISLSDQHYDCLEVSYEDRHQRNYMYPREFLGGYSCTPKGKEAEKIVYNVLSKVDEVMFVMHSKHFCANKVGEIDFLICNQDRGVILLEVKSGRKLKDYNQAEKQLENAATAIKIKVKKIKTGKDKSASVRYAVVMPNVSRHDDAATHVEGCYKEDLVSKEAFQSWMDKYMQRLDDGQKLTNEKYDKCLSTFLPIITDCATDKDHDNLMRLTPEQAAMLEGLSEEAYITGPAGSGKTECLVIKASSGELKDQKKLVVVFNRGLRDHLEKNRFVGVSNIKVLTFRKLLVDIANYQRRKRFYDAKNYQLVDVANQILSNTYPGDPTYPDRFDSIFVDEAQGLEGNWELLFDLLHIKGEQHYKWIFYDNNQMVSYSTPPKQDKRHQVYHLTRVIRNTINIFDTSMRFYHSNKAVKIVHNVVGPTVVKKHDFSDSDVRKLRPKLVNYLIACITDIGSDLIQVGPGDISILVENENRALSLQDKIEELSAGKVVPFDLEEMVEHLSDEQWPKDEVPAKKYGVTVDSVPRFAGQESKVIILVMDIEKTGQIVEKMYVGTTRALCKLIIVTSENGEHVLSRKCELAKCKATTNSPQEEVKEEEEEEEEEEPMEIE